MNLWWVVLKFPVPLCILAIHSEKVDLLILSRSSLIYQFECRHCECRYVGRTAQRLMDRIKQHVPKHLIEPEASDAPKKRRGRPPKKREPGEGYSSAIACHFSANKECARAYSEQTFSVLAYARNTEHLGVLEAMYIHALDPVLCRQKQFVTSLTLFKPHSMHSHK